jgi:hypothetical protein
MATMGETLQKSAPRSTTLLTTLSASMDAIGRCA